MKSSVLIISGIILLSACGGKKQTTESEAVAVDEAEVATTASDSAYVYFKYPADGAKVASPVFVEMGVSGMQVEPAGEVREGFGHHHILINQTSWPEGEVIPASDTTIHFGKGQTDTSLELEPGEYTLALQFADGVHTSYGESMAASIKITVE